ncbi:hypothetical protein XGA_4067 [Xanthomonas hortorum ATCC 19865]|nr:hypothetical protein XGA_4067 [Xanthomonas hortorum ATCC 19865]
MGRHCRLRLMPLRLDRLASYTQRDCARINMEKAFM